jgi:hypothetical protein
MSRSGSVWEEEEEADIMVRNIPEYIIIVFLLFVSFAVCYTLWSPGEDITDGRHDRRQNGIWIQHGWLGNDRWFMKNRKEGDIRYFRNEGKIKKLAAQLRRHNITDVFPHLSPASMNGAIPSVDADQITLFLDSFNDFRVMPWVGGVVGKQAFPGNPRWRKNFADSISRLLSSYPRLRGIHVNVEPCPSGNKEFLTLLDDIQKVLPDGRILSVAAFPPPTIWHPFPGVHWEREYYHQVAQRAGQLVIMMYDTAIRFEKIYQNVMANWTGEVLQWSKGTTVLLGIPAYKDEWAGYHDPGAENLKNALLGVHGGLSRYSALPDNYQGIALYSEWEMDNNEWEILSSHYEKQGKELSLTGSVPSEAIE